jgi:hypothetical protein
MEGVIQGVMQGPTEGVIQGVMQGPTEGVIQGAMQGASRSDLPQDLLKNLLKNLRQNYAVTAFTPGNSMPSRDSNIAPPPVLTYETSLAKPN